MNKVSKLVAVGNSTGVIVPQEMLKASGFDQGDEISITAGPGKIEIIAKADDFERQMEIAREVMQQRFRVLRELAK